MGNDVQMKRTWLLWWNYYVMRWTGFRLARVFVSVQDANGMFKRQQGWTIIGPVSPFEGWE